MHLNAWFVLAAHVAAVVFLRIQRRDDPAAPRSLSLPFGLSLAVIFASFLPWAGVLAHQVHATLDGYWIERPQFSALLATANAFVAPLPHWKWLAVAALLLLAAGARRRPAPVSTTPVTSTTSATSAASTTPTTNGPAPTFEPDSFSGSFGTVLLIAWATLPVAIPFVWSLLATPIFQVRYVLVAQPAILLLIARAIERRPRAGLAALAVVLAAAYPTAHHGLVYEDWRTAAAEITAHAAPTTSVYICADYTYFALGYYLDEHRFPITPVVAPHSRAAEFAAHYPTPPLAYEAWLAQLDKREAPAIIVLAHLQHTGHTHEDPQARDCGRRDVQSDKPIQDLPVRERILEDLRARGVLTITPLPGNLDVCRWSPHAHP